MPAAHEHRASSCSHRCLRYTCESLVRTLPCLACGTCSLSSVEDKSRRTDGPRSTTVPNTQGELRSRPSASGSVATDPDAPLSLRRFGFANMQGKLRAGALALEVAVAG